MRKIVFILPILILSTVLTLAQTSTDALRFSESFVNGSARYIGMGGAFGALGGDFSTLSSNPAGLGVYRSSEFSISTSFNKGNFTSEYTGFSTENDKRNLMLDNLGVVFAFKPEKEKESGIVGVNFGIGYNRSGNYNLESRLSNGVQYYSIMDTWALRANALGLNPIDLQASTDYDPYSNSSIPLDLIAAWNAFLIEHDGTSYYAPLYDGDVFKPTHFIQSEGGKHEYDFSLGLNFSHKLYFGMTLGLQSIDYSRYTVYTETLSATGDPDMPYLFDNLSYSENLSVSGNGFNFKLGAIYRPIESLRLGLAFHTPTYFSVDEHYSLSASSEFWDGDFITPASQTTETFKNTYDLETPFRTIASAAVVIGDVGLISFDYEYSDYSTMRFKNGVGGNMYNAVNDEIKGVYRATNSFRLGGEFRLDNVFFRAGGAYYSSPYKSELLNKNADNLIISGGIGYRHKSVYIDFAYSRLMHTEKYTFFDIRDNAGNLAIDPVTQKWAVGKAVLTLGIKF
ncbi:MAG: outer membrane protein transport protein [Bacteroidales bacterium]|nr:outer membrane protein transport protein [Bacteroidales bacterium]